MHFHVDRYVLGLAPAPKFLRSHILCILCKCPVNDTINRNPPRVYTPAREFTKPTHVNNNNNSILYSSQREIKAVIRSHNEEHISIILSHETRTYTFLLLDIRPLSLNLHTLTANPKLPGIMLSLSNQNVKTLK